MEFLDTEINVELLKVCRSCMMTKGLHDKEDVDKRIVEMFCTVTNLKITDEDKMPKQFCDDCINEIEVAHTFIENARKTDSTLRNILSRAQTSVIIEPNICIKQEKAIAREEDKIRLKPSSNNTFDNGLHFADDDLCDDEEEDMPLGNLKHNKIKLSAFSEDNVVSNEDKHNLNKCKVCQKEFISVTWFLRHTKKCHTHLERSRKACKIPSSNYTFANELDTADDKCFAIKDLDIPLGNLNLSKTKSRANSEDNATNNEDKSRLNKCSVCQREFVSVTWFVKHIKKCHTGLESTYNCRHCLKSFSQLSQLEAHSISHSDEPFRCKACNKSFKRRKQLNIHMKSHCEDRPYECDECHMRFKLKNILDIHKKQHGEKRYLCTECGDRFHQVGNLKTHMHRHTGDKPYVCKAAGCKFRTGCSTGLRRHQRRHASLRPHACPHCRKSFLETSALKRHVRTHTGELPYKCPHCERAFIDSWKCKRHLMLVHRLPLEDIPRLRAEPAFA